jgi:hypothetical protein
MKLIKLHRIISSYTIFFTIACEVIAYGQTPSRKPLPEDRLPIPDYYGLYAVTDNGLIELKKGNDAPRQTVGSGVEFIFPKTLQLPSHLSFTDYHLKTHSRTNGRMMVILKVGVIL